MDSSSSTTTNGTDNNNNTNNHHHHKQECSFSRASDASTNTTQRNNSGVIMDNDQHFHPENMVAVGVPVPPETPSLAEGTTTSTIGGAVPTLPELEEEVLAKAGIITLQQQQQQQSPMVDEETARQDQDQDVSLLKKQIIRNTQQIPATKKQGMAAQPHHHASNKTKSKPSKSKKHKKPPLVLSKQDVLAQVHTVNPSSFPSSRSQQQRLLEQIEADIEKSNCTMCSSHSHAGSNHHNNKHDKDNKSAYMETASMSCSLSEPGAHSIVQHNNSNSSVDVDMEIVEEEDYDEEEAHHQTRSRSSSNSCSSNNGSQNDHPAATNDCIITQDTTGGNSPLVEASLVETPPMAEIVSPSWSSPFQIANPTTSKELSIIFRGDAWAHHRKKKLAQNRQQCLKITAIVAVLVLLVTGVLTGIVCGTGHCRRSNQDQDENDSIIDNTTTSTTTSSQDLPEEIRIYTWDLNCVRLQEHANTFYDRTGIQVHIECVGSETEAGFTRDQFHDEILHDARTQTGLYDGYTLGPHLYGDLNELEGLFDLTPLIRRNDIGSLANFDLQWNDIFRFNRENGASYDRKILGIPIDGDVHSLYYRHDLFAKYNKQPPATWEEYTELAKFFHGREEVIPDGTNETTIISGSCVGKLERTEFWVFLILSSMTQYAGTSSGNLFDPRTMEPLLGEAFVKTLQFLEEQYIYGADNEYEGSFADVNLDRMNQGQCAMTYNWGDAFTEAAKAPPTSRIAGYLGTAQTPGSQWYLNRDTQRLQQCDPETCTCGNRYFPGHEKDDVTTTCINRAPYAAFTGWAGACSNNVEYARQRACAEFMGYISSAETSVDDTIPNITAGAPVITVDPFRTSQTILSAWTDRGLPENSTKQYLETIQSQLGSPNVALDMRIPGSADFQSSMNAVFRQHLTKLKQKRDRGLEGEELLLTEEERWDAEKDIRSQWKEIIRVYDRIHSPPLLEAYRKNLGYSP